MFAKYHYLSANFNNASRVYVATINDDICAFCAVLPFPHPKLKNTWKEHRTVVLPDFQGIGLGLQITNDVGHLLHLQGKKLICTSSNKALLIAKSKSDKWIVTRKGSRVSRGSENGIIQNKNKNNSTSSNRITYSFKYVGG